MQQLPQFPLPSVQATAVTPSSRDVRQEVGVDILKEKPSYKWNRNANKYLYNPILHDLLHLIKDVFFKNFEFFFIYSIRLMYASHNLGLINCTDQIIYYDQIMFHTAWFSLPTFDFCDCLLVQPEDSVH